MFMQDYLEEIKPTHLYSPVLLSFSRSTFCLSSHTEVKETKIINHEADQFPRSGLGDEGEESEGSCGGGQDESLEVIQQPRPAGGAGAGPELAGGDY